MSTPQVPSTPPPEEASSKIEYTKKARHGHNNDVTDVNNIRQVAGCLPIDPYSKRFLLISSSKNPEQWVIPKGGWESDETQEHAALRETWEEAGIKGRITRQIGVFVERSNKKIKAHHWIYEMEIDEVVKKYPERMKRDRRWFTYDEALIATGNNEYIKEAIQQSSISPAYQLSPRSSLDSFNNSSPKIDSTQFQSGRKNKIPATEISNNNSTGERTKDAFQALQDLMERTTL